jgi:hypothetical protein
MKARTAAEKKLTDDARLRAWRRWHEEEPEAALTGHTAPSLPSWSAFCALSRCGPFSSCWSSSARRIGRGSITTRG